MADLIKLTNQESFTNVFKNNNHVKLIWVLLVNKGPNKNPRHLKNICRYCKLFQFLDLDYLIVRIHASGQLAYNPVKQAMCILSGKLADITLPIDTFGFCLDSQSKVINQELAKKNFRHTGETLCTLWGRDLIFERHMRICQYSLNIRKCDDLTCCHPKRHEESAAFLAENDGFLSPVSKGWNGHYLNLVHILQYVDILKFPAYNAHCPFISPEMHHHLCCTFCGKYFPMLKMVTTHKKSEHMKQKKHKCTILSNSLADFSFSLTSTIPETNNRGCVSDD
ncbi:4909_t:CDS:2, partial [Cetraspora pellucida]